MLIKGLKCGFNFEAIQSHRDTILSFLRLFQKWNKIMPKFNKIDSNGNYTKFAGVTIVAPVQQSEMQENPWLGLYNSLKKSTLLSKYYALLPYQSYHMTTCHLYTEEETEEWLNFITSNLDFFQNLNAALKQHAFNPEATIKMIATAGVLQLRLTLPEDQKSTIQSIAKAFTLEKHIPYEFHITLAYEYKIIDDEKVYQNIKKEMEEIIQPYINRKIILNAPTLCYFENMTQFMPWDAKNNPFNEKKTSKTGLLSIFENRQTNKQVDDSNPSRCILS